jgi:hypothetical protein
MNQITATYLSILFHFNFTGVTPILEGIVQSEDEVGGEIFYMTSSYWKLVRDPLGFSKENSRSSHKRRDCKPIPRNYHLLEQTRDFAIVSWCSYHMYN